MRSLWIARVVVAAIALTFAAPLLVFEPAEASSQANSVEVSSNVVFIVQGENSVILGNESNNDFYALRIVSFSLPWDSSRVYTNMPEGAKQISVWTPSGTLSSSNYGRETSGPMSGKFFIDVPASHQRSSQFVNTTANESAFLAAGNTLDQLMYSAGALQLASGSEHGTFLSAAMPIASAHAVTSGNLTYSGSFLDNVTGEMSNDGGTSWVQCSNATEFNFTSTGISISVRFTFDGNSTLGFEPKITSFSLVAEYEMVESLFTVHLSYIWTDPFSGGIAAIDLTEALPYSSTGSLLVMLYTVKGYSAKSDGFNLSLDVTGTMGTYPDKNLYYYSTTSLPPPVSSSVQVSAPKPDYSWILYAGGTGGLLLVAVIYTALRRSSRRGKSVDAVSPGDRRPDDKIEPDVEIRRKELVSRKKEMLDETDRIKAEMSAGSLSHDEGKRKLAKLKTELKSVRNELNRIPRKSEPAARGVGAKPDSCGPLVGPYEAVLASLARIDDDFERGRLPESTYKSLRKEYVSKAAALMAEGKGGTDRCANPLEAEKVKLMEAIVALDEEHGKGELDAKVYEELRSSYRKELADLMKRIDQSENGG
jgi:hypothetical protein